MSHTPNVRNAARPVAQIGTLLETDFPELFPKKPVDQLTASQSAAWDRLEALSDIFFSDESRKGTIRPRLIPLLIGPSGAGKSWLVRAFGEATRRPVLRINARDWRPKAARAEPSTYNLVKAFVARNEHGIIHLDELDKATSGHAPDSEWTSISAIEIYDFLDGRMLTDSPNHNARFESGMFLVGSGTWQDAWRGPAATPMGFGGQAGSIVDRVRAMKSIPEELLFRFNGDPLLIAAPQAAELARLAETDGLCALARELGERIDFGAGEQSGLGVRWLEMISADLYIKKRAFVLKGLREVAYD
jgi:hypothetical protein